MSDLHNILAGLRVERRRLELIEVEPNKNKKVGAQSEAIVEEISELTDQMNKAKRAATPTQCNTCPQNGF